MFDHLTNPTLLDTMYQDYKAYQYNYWMWRDEQLLWKKWIREN